MDMNYHLLQGKRVVQEAHSLSLAQSLRWSYFMATGRWLQIKELAYVGRGF